MPDRVPWPEELQEIRRRAQTCRQATSRLWAAEHRLKAFKGHDRSVEVGEAIAEKRSAFEAWLAARADLDTFSKSGRMSPRGWSDRVLETLHKITAMCNWGLDFLIQAELDPTLGLEEEIESLAAVEERSEKAVLAPSASAAYEKVPNVRELERRYLEGVHDDMETTAKALEALGVIGPSEVRTDARGRRSLWVVWRNKPENLGRRTRKRKDPRS
jgi:hypothetical protein